MIDKIAAAGLANALQDGDSFIDVEEIRAGLPAELQPHVKNVVSLHSSLSGLWREDWVELKELKYRFRIDLFRRWVRHEHSVWHVIEELAAG